MRTLTLALILGAFTLATPVAAQDLTGPGQTPRPTLLQGEAPEGLWDGLADQITAHGFELRLGLPARPEESESRSILAGQILHPDPGRRPGAKLSHPVGLDYGEQFARLRLEE